MPRRTTKLQTRSVAIDLWMRLPHLRTSPHPASGPTGAPFKFNGSLTKLGVREKLAAEELVDQWTVQFLSGNGGSLDPRKFKAVEQEIKDYLKEKRGTLEQNKGSAKLTIKRSTES